MNKTPNSRFSALPFSIPLAAQDYSISIQDLNAVADETLQRKTAYFSPHLRFKSFRGNQLILLNNYREECYHLQIGIEPGSLTVSCSCNQPVQSLCIHSYRALKEIAFRRENYFQYFAPGGWASTALANKKAFVFNDEQLGPLIKPLPPHSKVYGLNMQLPLTANLLAQQQTTPRRELQPTYIILSFSRRCLPPILMPCLYKPAKTGTGIKSFASFPETIAAGNAHHFTEIQQQLNSYCLVMLKEAEKISATNDYYGREWQWQQYTTLFNLWQQAWPLLSTQPFIVYSHIYQLKFLRKKPWLRNTKPITVSTEKPVPQFQLRQFPDHRRFSMDMMLQNNLLQTEAGILPFFAICPETNCFYLLPTIHMAQLVADMHDAEPFISVFKQQYKSFQKQVLKPLQQQKLLTISKQKNPKRKSVKKTSNRQSSS